MRTPPDWLKMALIALALGMVIGFVDSRPTWDDAGITAGAIVIVAAVLVYLKPRQWWITIPCLVLPVIAFNYFTNR